MIYRCFNIEYNITELDIESYAETDIDNLTDEEIDNIVAQIEDNLPHELFFELSEEEELDPYEALGDLIVKETEFDIIDFTAEPLANEKLPIEK